MSTTIGSPPTSPRMPGSLNPTRARWRKHARMILVATGVCGGLIILAITRMQSAPIKPVAQADPATNKPATYQAAAPPAIVAPPPITEVAFKPTPTPAIAETPVPPPPVPQIVVSNFHRINEPPKYLNPPPPPTSTATPAPAHGPTGNPASGIIYKAQNLAGTTAFVIKKPEFQLPEGTLIPCVLNNEIITGVSGINGFTCNVSQDIKSPYDITLLDKGTVIDGEYGSTVNEGQYRIVAVAKGARTPPPYNVAVSLEGEPVGDQLGAAGVEGSVNEHWGRRIGAALALAFLDAGVAIGQAALQNGSGTFVNVGNSMGQGGPFSQVGQSILNKEMSIPPTIVLKQGQTLTLRTTKYIDFSGVYRLEAVR